MPIKPENRARYPKNWGEISHRIRERAGWACEFCGVQNGALGGRRSRDGAWMPAHPKGERMLSLEWPAPGEVWWCGDKEEQGVARLKIIRIVLTVAHLDHVPENCDPDNLKALCQRCHLVYDAKHHARNAAETRRKKLGMNDLFATTTPAGAPTDE